MLSKKKRSIDRIMKRRILISFIFLFTLLLSGCADKNLTVVHFESYNQLENPKGVYRSGDEFTFEINQQRYEVMDGYAAEYLRLIKEDEDNRYKLVMVNSKRNVVFSMITEKNCVSEAVRECTDTDGKVYILYSKWDSAIGNLFLEDLKSTHILKMDMINYTVTKQYDFGESIVVITIHDGYVYTMEDGRVYRELLGQTGSKECMADLGFRGMPNIEEFASLTFSTEVDCLKVIATIIEDSEEYSYKDVTLADVKYTDSPIESE